MAIIFILSIPLIHGPFDFDDTPEEPDSTISLRLPKFSGKFLALEPNVRGERPDRLLGRHPSNTLPRSWAYNNHLGWVDDTPNKPRGGELFDKMREDLKEEERKGGIIYVRKHIHYTNLYKIGTTTNTEEVRNATSDPCVRNNTDSEYSTGRVMRAKRAERLAHLHMATGKVRLRVCEGCFAAKGRFVSHREWFKGDLEDIEDCVDFWADFVEGSYDVDGVFVGEIPSELYT